LQIDLDAIRQHYASLSDEELLHMSRADLTEAAQRCYDEEFSRRGLNDRPRSGRTVRHPSAGGKQASGAFAEEAETDWLEDAACACSFASGPEGAGAAEAENARQVLEDAGIPCQISTEEIETESRPDDAPRRAEYRVMVPGALNMIATSVLDKEIFNEELDSSWRAHFEALTDDQLRAVDPELICAGLADRIERLQRAYYDEIARRKIKRG
jgi:hypothetical protein